MAFSLLHEFTVFSLFPIIIGDVLQRTAAAAIDQQVTDGGQFFQRIVHGDKISQNPGYLLFTAPYKLCEGGCQNDEKNFAMAFPIYIGKRGVEKYHELYARDRKNLHSDKPNAPFEKRPTKKLFTLCKSKVTKDQTTEMTKETETTTTETILTTETSTKEYTNTKEAKIITVEPPTTSETLPSNEPDTTSAATHTELLIPISDLSTNLETTTSFSEIFTSNTITESSINTNTEEPSTIDSDARPSHLNTDVTETEDITFEAYTDGLYTDTIFVTNANGVRCPPSKCRKKKSTAAIVTLLARNRPDAMKLDQRNADWNSDYSDLLDSLDVY